MATVEIVDADLANLVARARNGEEIVLTVRGDAQARIVAASAGTTPAVSRDERIHQPVKLGRLRGQFKVPDDFDAPLPDDILDLFEGRS